MQPTPQAVHPSGRLSKAHHVCFKAASATASQFTVALYLQSRTDLPTAFIEPLRMTHNMRNGTSAMGNWEALQDKIVVATTSLIGQEDSRHAASNRSCARHIRRLYVVACCSFGLGIYRQGGWPLALNAKAKATSGFHTDGNRPSRWCDALAAFNETETLIVRALPDARWWRAPAGFCFFNVQCSVIEHLLQHLRNTKCTHLQTVSTRMTAGAGRHHVHKQHASCRIMR